MKKQLLVQRILMALSLGAVTLLPVPAYALPQGMDSTTAKQVTSGTSMNITGSAANNLINWTAFSIAKGESVVFDGKNYLNLVRGGDMSTIYGALSNPGGTLYLINPNGILFGSSATVNVGSLVASTRWLDDVDKAGFQNGKDPLAQPVRYTTAGITNLGSIAADKLLLEGNRIVLLSADTLHTADGKQLLNNTTGSVVLRSGGKSAAKLKQENDKAAAEKLDANGMETYTDRQMLENETLFYTTPNHNLFDNTGYVDIGAAATAEAATSVNDTQYRADTLKAPDYDALYTVEQYDGTKLSGKVNTYWLVRNAAELQNIHNNAQANYMLTDTVDLKGSTWQPVANYSGNFNGLGNGILNMQVTGQKDADTGFVGELMGSVRGVDFVNAKVKGSGKAKVGIVAGNVVLTNYGAQQGVIADVNTSGTVQGDANGSTDVGGIAGVNTGGIIHDVVNTAVVKDGSHTAGGIAGIIEGNGVVVRAANTASITTAATSGVGGITGMNFGTIRYGYNTGNIENTSMTPIPDGPEGDRVGSFAAGIAGRNGFAQQNPATPDGKVYDCVNKGNYTAAISVFEGGIAGRGDQGHNTGAVNNYVWNGDSYETRTLQPAVDDAAVGTLMTAAIKTGTTRLSQQKVTQPVNPGKTDPGKTDPGKTDPGKTDTPADPGKTDPGKTDTPTDPGKTDPGKTDTPADPGKAEPHPVIEPLPEPVVRSLTVNQEGQSVWRVNTEVAQLTQGIMHPGSQASQALTSPVTTMPPQAKGMLADYLQMPEPQITFAPQQSVAATVILRPQAAQPVTVKQQAASAAATTTAQASVATVTIAPQSANPSVTMATSPAVQSGQEIQRQHQERKATHKVVITPSGSHQHAIVAE
ncbi:MAG: filamentous hemagglutinin N-terminal domain-containing protein [Selenomonadaceae bacterium]|nr:filamentous hemagglutinin N-terminal domain-containing protein [Selenomonadaceae bacterium]